MCVCIYVVICAFPCVASGMQPLGRGYNRRCLCFDLESRVIPPDKLRSVEILPSGPHCRNAEVVAQLAGGEKICLNHRAPWVRRLVRFILEKEPHQTALLH
uniref:Chemokine interleukin-8-like domain-containing protein n=1 Tax=Denticeps clupeoides TaxID=299321 RepID=A0AAY4BPP0_9TELE